jgi:hypothetical protein
MANKKGRPSKGAAMTGHKLGFGGLMLCLQLVFTPAAWAQLSEAARSAVLISTNYEVLPNITYGIANNYELKLDVYRPTTAKAPTPVVMLIHRQQYSWGLHGRADAECVQRDS